MAEQGKFAASISAMERVLKDVPRDVEVLEHLACYQAAAGQNFEAHLHYAKAFAYKREFRKYEYHLRQAEGQIRNDRQRTALDELRVEIDEYRDILRGKTG